MSSPIVVDNSEAAASNSNGVETMNGVNGDVNGAVNGTATEKPKSPSSNKTSGEEENNGSANEGFEEITLEETVKNCTFTKLMEKMLVSQYDAASDEDSLINLKCKLLFERDYIVEVVKNDSFTSNYPKEIIVPIGKKGEKEIRNLMDFDKEMYSQLVQESLIARIRSRFVAPVILFDNKFICRSGTLTVWTSACYEMTKLWLPNRESLSKLKQSIPTVESLPESILSSIRAATHAPYKIWETACEYAKLLMSSTPLDDIYAKDVKILEHLKIERICDLMVEYNKHYRNILNVSSTEKVSALYESFKKEEMPYPGCEFFTEYSETRAARHLVFDWNQSDVKRTLVLTENPPKLLPQLEIEKFESWDLVTLTENYVATILWYLVTGSGGIAVHCISGWDRTPMFISLIRLSLWADGLIHQSLNVEEMAYLTVAYDWYLFGHNLPDRIAKHEEVMRFSFNLLGCLSEDGFSVIRMFNDLPPEKRGNRILPDFEPYRREVLLKIVRLVLETYDKLILKMKNE